MVKEQKSKEKTPKHKKEKRERTPREATSLMLGGVSLGLAVAAVGSLLFLSTLVGLILGICAVLIGFSGLMVGKGGTLLSVVGAGAGFLTILSAILTMKLQ